MEKTTGMTLMGSKRGQVQLLIGGMIGLVVAGVIGTFGASLISTTGASYAAGTAARNVSDQSQVGIANITSNFGLVGTAIAFTVVLGLVIGIYAYNRGNA